MKLRILKFYRNNKFFYDYIEKWIKENERLERLEKRRGNKLLEKDRFKNESLKQERL